MLRAAAMDGSCSWLQHHLAVFDSVCAMYVLQICGHSLSAALLVCVFGILLAEDYSFSDQLTACQLASLPACFLARSLARLLACSFACLLVCASAPWPARVLVYVLVCLLAPCFLAVLLPCLLVCLPGCFRTCVVGMLFALHLYFLACVRGYVYVPVRAYGCVCGLRLPLWPNVFARALTCAGLHCFAVARVRGCYWACVCDCVWVCGCLYLCLTL